MDGEHLHDALLRVRVWNLEALAFVSELKPFKKGAQVRPGVASGVTRHNGRKRVQVRHRILATGVGCDFDVKP